MDPSINVSKAYFKVQDKTSTSCFAPLSTVIAAKKRIICPAEILWTFSLFRKISHAVHVVGVILTAENEAQWIAKPWNEPFGAAQLGTTKSKDMDDIKQFRKDSIMS